MPLTTRRGFRALASGLLAAGLAVAVAAPALATARPDFPSSGTRPASTTVVTPGTGPLSVAVLVPIVAPPTTSGLIPAEDLERYTGQFGTLTRQLDAISGSAVTLAIDPMVLASIRVLGRSAPESALAWLTRLEALPNEAFTLAYGDADLVTAARTDTLAALQPSGFGFALDPADFSPVEPEPTETPTPAPTETPDPDAAPPFPTTDELLGWVSTLPSIAWPADETLGAQDLAPVAAAGYEDVVVSSELVGSSTPLVALEGVQGIVSDAALSASFREAFAAISEADRAAALAALDEGLAAEVASSPGRGVVLTLDRGWANSMSGAVETLTHLQTVASAQSVTLGEILDTTATSASLADAAADEDREQVFTSLADDAAAELTFSSVVVDPAPLLDTRGLARIALYANGWRPDETGWNEAVDAFHTDSEAILSSVRIERGSDVVLLARNTDFRVAVSNELPYAISVLVGVRPQSPILRVEGDVELTVEPQSTGSARVPVEAVANGDVIVQTTLHSPTGVPIDSAFVRVTAQAEWEGIGTTVFVAILLIVFGAGIVRLILRRRRARASAAVDGESDDADADAGAVTEEPRG